MNPDAIFYGGGDAQSSPMIRKMRQLGMKSAFVTGEMSRSPTFLKVGGDAAEGAIVYMGGLPKEKMPGFAGYAARYKARFNEDVITYAVLVRRHDRATHRDEGRELDRPEGVHAVSRQGVGQGRVGPSIAYDTKGDLRDAPVTIYKVEHGAFAGRYDRRQLIRKPARAARQRLTGRRAARASASASASRSEPFLGAHPRACISRSCRIPHPL